MTTAEMQHAVDVAVKTACAAVPRLGMKPFPVKFEWLRSSRNVGEARSRTVRRSKNDMTPVGREFTVAILKSAWDEMSKVDRFTVLMHEVCHVVVDRYVRASDPHGPAWVSLMKACGADPRLSFRESTPTSNPEAEVRTNPSGEWWIDKDGTTTYCDGDVGDVNHEMVVLGELNHTVLEVIGKDEGGDDDTGIDVQNAIREAMIESGVSEHDATLEKVQAEWLEAVLEGVIVKADERASAVKVVMGWEDAREHSIRFWGWIRVKKHDVEMYELTAASMRRLANGLGDLMWEEDDEGDHDRELFNVEIVGSPRRFFVDVPFVVIQSAKPGAMREYLHMTGNPARGAKAVGYRVMRYVDGAAVSAADSRIRLKLQRNLVHRYPGRGMFLSTSKDYVRTHYAGHDQNVLMTYEFDPADITSGNLTDREPEVSVPSAKLIAWEIFDEDGRAQNPARRPRRAKPNPPWVPHCHAGPRGLTSLDWFKTKRLPGFLGPGIYLTTDRRMAERYIGDHGELYEAEVDVGGLVDALGKEWLSIPEAARLVTSRDLNPKMSNATVFAELASDNPEFLVMGSAEFLRVMRREGISGTKGMDNGAPTVAVFDPNSIRLVRR